MFRHPDGSCHDEAEAANHGEHEAHLQLRRSRIQIGDPQDDDSCCDHHSRTVDALAVEQGEVEPDESGQSAEAGEYPSNREAPRIEQTGGTPVERGSEKDENKSDAQADGEGIVQLRVIAVAGGRLGAEVGKLVRGGIFPDVAGS